MANGASTLEDVANLAGVSKSTASRILAAPKDARIPYAAGTRQKVVEAAAKLEYKPSKLARGLTMAKTGIVGLVVPSLTDSFFPIVTSAIEARLAEAGYSIILTDSTGNSKLEKARVEDLLSWHVDGLIIAPSQEAGQAGLYWDLWQSKVSFVLIDRSFPETPFCAVTTQDEAGAELAVEHLIAQGRRRIARVGGPLRVSTNRLRQAGYAAALIRHGMVPRPDYAVESQPSEEGGRQALARLRGLNPAPDAVFCFSDLQAFGLMKACGREGLRVPDDLAVVGYADLPQSDWLKVSLTTIRQPQAELGRRAADMLLAAMKHPGYSEQVTLPVQLIARESSGGHPVPH